MSLTAIVCSNTRPEDTVVLALSFPSYEVDNILTTSPFGWRSQNQSVANDLVIPEQVGTNIIRVRGTIDVERHGLLVWIDSVRAKVSKVAIKSLT